MEQLEQQLLLFIRDVYGLFGWPGVVALMAIETVFAPVPSELVMPLSGWMLIRDQGLGEAYVLLAGLYGAAGSTIGSVLIYLVGTWGGRPFLYRYGKYVLISHNDLDRAERWFEKYGQWVVFFSRLIPQVRSFISLPAGVVRMHFPKFLLFTFLGSFLWCLGLAYGGYKLGEHWERIRDIMRPFDIPIIMIILLLVAFYIWHQTRRPSHTP